ncbi:MAG: hypothetical protein JSU71_05815 [Betaproteobacteria bacterium]|nr:MAG: hypothetical protein JSU71_05815 [Betaproteobacteria bacterium]
MKEINEVPVSYDELREYMAALTRAVKRGEHFDPHSEMAKKHPGDLETALAIIMRASAFSELNVEDFKGFGYEIKGGGFDMVSLAAVHAAAECPLRGEKYPYFDPAEFRELCLKHADTEGTS